MAPSRSINVIEPIRAIGNSTDTHIWTSGQFTGWCGLLIVMFVANEVNNTPRTITSNLAPLQVGRFYLCLECTRKKSFLTGRLTTRHLRTFPICNRVSIVGQSWTYNRKENGSKETTSQYRLFPLNTYKRSGAQDMTNASMSGCCLNWYAMSILLSMSNK